MSSALYRRENPIEVASRAARRGMWACLTAFLVALLFVAGCAEFPTTTITTSQLPNARPGLAYAAALSAMGGSPPYRWAITSGALPHGVKLDARTGALSGVPSQIGSFGFTVRVADSSIAKPGTDARPLAMVVGIPSLQITTSSLPNAQTGIQFHAGATAEGGVQPYRWSVASGILPSGVSLNADSGILSGKTSQRGQFDLSMQVSDSSSPTPQAAVKALTLSVAAAAGPSITTQPTGQTVTIGQAANFSVTASGTAPLSYQWRKNGAAISGATSPNYKTPATSASDNGSQFTVVVTDSIGNVTSNAATLTVNAAGQLTASATNLNYGNITVGSNSMRPVTLTNTGGSSVSISNVTLSGAGVTTSGVSSGLSLGVGNSAALNVAFAPSASGSMNGSVTISSNASNPTVTISLSGTAVQPVSHSATLFWTASSASVVGYNVYRSFVSGGPYAQLNSAPVSSTTYKDSTVLASQTYFYAVTSVDSTGNQSVDSNEVSVKIPTP